MNHFINIADLKDISDPQGRTYRQINNDTQHTFNVGSLVELEGGCRLFIAKLTRDCDGTPLYTLTHDIDSGEFFYGYPEYSIKKIIN